MAAHVENMFSTLFQTYTSSDSCNPSLEEMLNVFHTNQLISLQKVGSIQDVISHVHTCLGSSKHRAEGLLFLAQIVDQSSTEVFQKHATTWMKLLLQTLQSHCPAAVFRASCYVLGQIFTFSQSFTDLSREIVSTVIPQLLPLLLNCSAEVKEAAAACISSCITTYPGPVGPFKTKIEAFLNDSAIDIQVLCRCYALLAQAGPSGSQGSKHTEAWNQQCDILLANLEYTLGNLYDGLERGPHSQARPSTLLIPLDMDQSLSVPQLVTGWKKVSGCLAALLSERTTAVAHVPANQILQVVCRCLSINNNIVLSRPTTERTLLAASLQDVHVAALDILEQLILTCGSLLVSHGSIIVSQLSQLLTWTQTSPTGHHSQYRYLRERVYDVMVTWMKVVDGCSSITSEEKIIVKQILLDCKPMMDTLQLSSLLHSNKQEEALSKTKKQKGYQEISQGISSQRKIQPFPNSSLVSKGLEALYWMITTVGSELERQAMQEIQRFTVETLLLIQRSMELPAPYRSASCRRALYRVLQACLLAPHPSALPPIQCAIGLLAEGRRDRNIEVSSYCVEVMRICECLIHPRVPCLNGPVVCENLVEVGVTSSSTVQPLVNGATPINVQDTDNSASRGNHDLPSSAQVQKRSHTFEDVSRKRTLKDDGVGFGKKVARIDLDDDDVNESGHGISKKVDPKPSTSRSLDSNTRDAVDVIDIDEDSDDEESNEDNDDVTIIDDFEGSSQSGAGTGRSREELIATRLPVSEGGSVDRKDSVAVKEGDSDKAGDRKKDEMSSDDECVDTSPSKNPESDSTDKMVDAMLGSFVPADPDDD